MICHDISPRDDIGPMLRALESVADDLHDVNPLRLAGDLERIAKATENLQKLASAVKLAHRTHGLQAAE